MGAEQGERGISSARSKWNNDEESWPLTGTVMGPGIWVTEHRSDRGQVNVTFMVQVMLFDEFSFDRSESKSQVQAQSQIEKRKRNLDSGLSLKSL